MSHVLTVLWFQLCVGCLVFLYHYMALCLYNMMTNLECRTRTSTYPHLTISLFFSVSSCMHWNIILKHIILLLYFNPAVTVPPVTARTYDSANWQTLCALQSLVLFLLYCILVPFCHNYKLFKPRYISSVRCNFSVSLLVNSERPPTVSFSMLSNLQCSLLIFYVFRIFCLCCLISRSLQYDWLLA